jgi:hypothetical protein
MGTVSFGPGDISKTITINVQGDHTVEADEAFGVQLSNASTGSGIFTDSATATITNDDSSLSIAATDASKAEGNSGTTPFTFTVTRSGTLSGAASAHWQVIGGTSPSANPADFPASVVPSGTVSFAAGETSQIITVNVAGDSAIEADESFQVVLGQAAGAAITTGAATGTILNDDSSLSISAADANKAEGDGGTTPFTFTVTRAGALSGAASAHWQVIGGTSPSANPADFPASVVPSGIVSFAAGETTQMITVNVAGDTAIEADESFQVVLGQAAGCAIIMGAATGTILNDDGAVPVSGFGTSTMDFDGDGVADGLRQVSGGDLFVMNGADDAKTAVSLPAAGLSFVGAADFDGDSRSDLLLQGAGAELYDWAMSGALVLHSDLVTTLGVGQSVAGVKDYTDGQAGILLYNDPAQSGGAGSWTLLAMHGTSIANATQYSSLPDGW